MTHAPSQMPELKPCPFCGGEANSFGYGSKFSVVHCNNYANCTMKPEINTKISMADAVTAWNTRAVPEGYALVPLEPTEEMVNEYFDATRITLEGGASGTLAVIEGYRAMIAAAQKGGE